MDPLGLPVFSATTPLARDLTIHTGKGLDAVSARISAMSEALERISAETVERSVLTSSYRELSATGDAVCDPFSFDLPRGSDYTETKSVTWIDGWDLQRNEPTWLPLDLALNPPTEGVLHQVDTNGLAAGNILQEAVFHGLCEVIERDALGLQLFVALFGDPGCRGPNLKHIDPSTIPPAAAQWLTGIEESDCALEIQCLTTEIGIPVFRSIIVDHNYPSGEVTETRTFMGAGASPNAEIGLLRSITEAVQSRVGVVQGARDSFNCVPAPIRYSNPAAYLDDLSATHQTPFTEIPSFESNDLTRDLDYVLSRLLDGGFDSVVAVDLTRAEIAMPVVRVRIPGLSSFLVNRDRVGLRCLRYLL